jgi:hypothetical protein
MDDNVECLTHGAVLLQSVMCGLSPAMVNITVVNVYCHPASPDRKAMVLSANTGIKDNGTSHRSGLVPICSGFILMREDEFGHIWPRPRPVCGRQASATHDAHMKPMCFFLCAGVSESLWKLNRHKNIEAPPIRVLKVVW